MFTIDVLIAVAILFFGVGGYFGIVAERTSWNNLIKKGEIPAPPQKG